MTESTAHLILTAVHDLRTDLTARDEALEERLGMRLDRMEATATDEHRDTIARVVALEKAGTVALAEGELVVRLARCFAATVAAVAAIVGILAAAGVL